MKSKCVLLFIFLISYQSFSQTAPPDPINKAELNTFIDSLLVQWNVPGLAISVVKENDIIYSNGFGFKNTTTKDRVTDSTLFSIASSTKSFTSALAVILENDSIVNLDEPVSGFYPDIKWYNETLQKNVTLRDMLSHRVGVPRQKFYTLNVTGPSTKVIQSLRFFEPTSELRYRFNYSNEMYTITGVILGDKAGVTWKDLIKENILEPLDMHNTYLSINDLSEKNNFAHPYIDWGNGIEELDRHNADMLGAAGAIISNVKDLSQWIKLWLNRWTINGKTILPMDKVMNILAPHTTITTFTRDEEIINQSYGLGWFIEAYRGNLHIHHGGVLYGFTSLVSFMPKQKVGIVVLCNLNNSPLPTILARTIYDKLLELDPIDWNKRAYEYDQRVKAYYKRLEEEESSNKIKIEYDAEKYSGKFVSGGYGDLVLIREADSLVTTMLGYKCPVKPLSKDIFTIYHPVEHMDFKIEYRFDEKNNVTGFELDIMNGAKPVFFVKEK